MDISDTSSQLSFIQLKGLGVGHLDNVIQRDRAVFKVLLHAFFKRNHGLKCGVPAAEGHTRDLPNILHQWCCFAYALHEREGFAQSRSAFREALEGALEVV
jgi:hypothetical protein